MLRKYAITYQNALAVSLQYRLNLALFAVSHLVSLSGLVYLWLAVYGAGQTLPGYTLTEIITYYIVLTVLRLTIADGVAMGFEVCDEIKDGLIAHYLLKPYSYSLAHALKLFGQATINFALVIPALALIAAVSRGYIHLPGALTLAQFAGLTLLGLIFYFLIYFFAALSSFWLHRGASMIYGVIVVSNLLNGSIIPLNLFPDWFQSVSRYAPFQFLVFLPIQSYLGKVTDWPEVIATALIWVALIIFFIKLAWRQGLKKFEAVGQ